MKDKGGRPPKFETKEEVEAIIERYFSREGNAYIDLGDGAKLYAPTISGLAYELDLSRQGLLEYSNKEEFSDTIKKAKQKVEIALEQKLQGQAVTGTIFNLKNNFGWRDQQDHKLSGSFSVTVPDDDAGTL